MSIYDKIELINKNLDGLSLLKAFEYIIKEVEGKLHFLLHSDKKIKY